MVLSIVSMRSGAFLGKKKAAISIMAACAPQFFKFFRSAATVGAGLFYKMLEKLPSLVDHRDRRSPRQAPGSGH